ncbi:MBL fold metallo-hydrolase [Aliikangiella marina]|uniref:MBL fold metallo-hydrolase n=1 Tax=Aliikangiella marina TaxID=1712262 RepID=UPI00163D8C47|nr:MBL fold metallo-hydrolase [Aliikangiella marina]
MQANVETFFDKPTFSFTHVVSDPTTGQAAIIDPVLDYDAAAINISQQSAQKLLDYIEANRLTVKWLLETHVHADHLTAAHWLKQQTGAPTAIGEGIKQVQETFNQIYELEGSAAGNQSDFDMLLKDGDTLPLGELTIQVMATPGHTPACCTYLVDDAAFVGDTLFMPDYGTARCDFPAGDAQTLYQSIQKTLALAADTRLFMCHDYMPGGRELQWVTTVAEQKAKNIHINDTISETAFVEMRTTRDQQLSVPKLILPALQINMRAGRLPEPSSSGVSFLKLPINQFT